MPKLSKQLDFSGRPRTLISFRNLSGIQLQTSSSSFVYAHHNSLLPNLFAFRHLLKLPESLRILLQRDAWQEPILLPVLPTTRAPTRRQLIYIYRVRTIQTRSMQRCHCTAGNLNMNDWVRPSTLHQSNHLQCPQHNAHPHSDLPACHTAPVRRFSSPQCLPHQVTMNAVGPL